MTRSKAKQIPEREQIKQELMENICDYCRFPDMLSEDALPAKCDECEIAEKMKCL